MPAKVERPCSSMNAPHHHDHTTRSNAHHKEALRLALGSILAPKRSLTPMSRSCSSSGSATPAIHHDSCHAASLGWPHSDSAHAHIRPSCCSSLPHTHSHSPSAHSTHGHPQTTPPGVHPPQTTHPHHPHPLSTHPSHPSTFARPDLNSSTSSLPAPQMPQGQGSTYHPPSHPHSHSYSPPSHGQSLTPPNVSGHSNIPSGAVTPGSNGSMSESPSSRVHSPSVGPSSIPEEEPLQMLPPLVAAGSSTANGEVFKFSPPPEQVVPRPRSHPLPSMMPALEAAEMGDMQSQANRAGFIKTLQTKNKAWDALIHGSFS